MAACWKGSSSAIQPQEFRDGAAVEHTPLHGGALHHRALGRLEAVDDTQNDA